MHIITMSSGKWLLSFVVNTFNHETVHYGYHYFCFNDVFSFTREIEYISESTWEVVLAQMEATIGANYNTNFNKFK